MIIIFLIPMILLSCIESIAQKSDPSSLSSMCKMTSSVDCEIKKCEKSLKSAKQGLFKQAFTEINHKRCPLTANLVVWLALKSDKHPLPFKMYQDFLQKNPGWPWESTLRKQAEFKIDEKTPSKDVLVWFRQNSPKTVNGLLFHVKALESIHQSDKAKHIVCKFWIEEDFKLKDENKIINCLTRYLNQTMMKERAHRLLNQGKLDAAERLLPHLSSQNRYVVENRLSLQRKQFHLKKDETVQSAWLEQDPNLIKDYLIWLRQQQNDQVFNYFKNIESIALKFPEMFWKERYILSREALEASRVERAYELAANHHLTTGVNFVEAEWFSGWISLQFLNNPQQAFTHFSRIEGHVKTAISQSRIYYWLGRTAENLSQFQNASKFYEKAAKHRHTFYGQQAYLKLEGNIKNNFNFKKLKFTSAQQSDFERDPYVKSIKILHHAHFEEEILFFAYVYVKRQKVKHLQEQMLNLIYKIAPQYSVSIAQIVTEGGDDIYEASYPLLNEDFDIKITQDRDKAALIHSIILKESKFTATVVSPAGAMGLMQLMPTTAREMASEKGISFNPKDLLSNPKLNVNLGTHYVSKLQKKFDFSILLVLSAYNAGPGNPLKWILRFYDPRRADVDPLDWIEILPYSETRNYLHRVLENLFIYKKRLALH